MVLTTLYLSLFVQNSDQKSERNSKATNIREEKNLFYPAMEIFSQLTVKMGCNYLPPLFPVPHIHGTSIVPH